MQLRPHQVEVAAKGARLAEAVSTGKKSSAGLYLNVVPGGGKSLCVALFARELLKCGLIDLVIWVAPRLNLQAQAKDAFKHPLVNEMRFYEFCGTVEEYERSCDAGRKPFGFATNYHKLFSCPERHIDALSDQRALLVADEVHHCKAALSNGVLTPIGAWATAFAQLRQVVLANGGHELLMTGTPFRTDDMAVLGTKYHRKQVTTPEVAKKRSPFFRLDDAYDNYVELSRREALYPKEGTPAVVPVSFHLIDGVVEWSETRGDIETNHGPVQLSEVPLSGPIAGAIRSFVDAGGSLDTTIKEVLDRAFADRKRDGNKGQILVVAKSCKDASAICRRLRKWHSSIASRIGLAVSDMSDDDLQGYSDFTPKAREQLAAFRYGKLDVLVTVAMAYEGMDAPKCDRLVHLGTYRSTAWMMQCLARIWRQGGWKTDCHVYAPHDKRLIRLKDDLALDPKGRKRRDEQRFFLARESSAVQDCPPSEADLSSSAAADDQSAALVDGKAEVLDTEVDPVTPSGNYMFFALPTQSMGWTTYERV